MSPERLNKAFSTKSPNSSCIKNAVKSLMALCLHRINHLCSSWRGTQRMTTVPLAHAPRDNEMIAASRSGLDEMKGRAINVN